MRFKKQIIIVCLLTFLFVPFNYSKEAKAMDLLVTPSIVYLVSKILVTSGVAITSSVMLYDIADKFVKSPVSSYVKENLVTGSVEYLLDSTSNKLLDDFINSLPSVKANVTIPITHGFNSDGNFTVAIDLPWDIYSKYTYSEPLIYNLSIDKQPECVGSCKGHSLNVKGFNSEYSGEFSKFVGNIKCGAYPIKMYNDSGKLFINQYSFSSYYDSKVKITSFYCPDIVGDVTVTNDFVGEAEYDGEYRKGYNPTYIPSGLVSAPIVPPIPGSSFENGYGLEFPLTNDKVGTIPGDIVSDGVVSPPVEESKPDTGDSVFDKFGEWLSSLLGSLFAPLVNLLNSILDFLMSLIKSLVSAIGSLLEGLFVPTVNVGDLFVIPSGSGFGNIVSLFDWGIFDITPKPYEFITDLNFNNFMTDEVTTQTIEINIFDNKVVSKYLPIVRNVLSYSLLISTILIIVWHFLPKRDID